MSFTEGHPAFSYFRAHCIFHLMKFLTAAFSLKGEMGVARSPQCSGILGVTLGIPSQLTGQIPTQEPEDVVLLQPCSARRGLPSHPRVLGSSQDTSMLGDQTVGYTTGNTLVFPASSPPRGLVQVVICNTKTVNSLLADLETTKGKLICWG